MRNVDQIRDSAHQTLLVLVEIPVGLRDSPKELYDVAFLFGAEAPIDDSHELMEIQLSNPFLKKLLKEWGKTQSKYAIAGFR